MTNLLQLALRNLARYRRRTVMTALLITVGVVAVMVVMAVGNAFKRTMIGSITDSMLGHIQIHRRGYVSSIDNLPSLTALQNKGKAVSKPGNPGGGLTESFSLSV